LFFSSMIVISYSITWLRLGSLADIKPSDVFLCELQRSKQFVVDQTGDR
jgi:hypothetical protein